MKMFVGQLKLNKISLLAGLGLSAILFTSNAHANTPKTFTKQEQADLMAKGMWYDERTGLIWDRCSVGQTWNDNTCVGTPTRIKYNDLLSSITQLNIKKHLGYSDWSLPTFDQLATIANCPVFQRDGKGYGQDAPPHGDLMYYVMCHTDYKYQGEDDRGNKNGWIVDSLIINNMPTTEHTQSNAVLGYPYWSSSQQKKVISDSKVTYKFYGSYVSSGNVTPFITGPDHLYARLVRTTHFKGKGALMQIEAQREAEYKTWQTEQDHIAKEKAKLEAKRKAEAQARQAEQARKEQEAYDKKVANFRKNLKVGDDASAGMVIEIKGDLVKIQTNDSQCSQRDHKGNCSNWINTPVEKWVKRRELYPAN